MAAIATINKTLNSTIQSTDQVNFTEALTTDDMIAGTTYHCVIQMLISAGHNSEYPDNFRLIDQTNSDVVLPGSIWEATIRQNGVMQTYCWIGVVTAGTDGGGIQFQQKCAQDDTAIMTGYGNMLLMDLSNMNPDDYFFEYNDTVTDLTETYQSFSSKTVTAKENDDWLVWGMNQTGTPHHLDNDQSEWTLSCDDPDITNGHLPFSSFEPYSDEADEIWLQSMCRGYTKQTDDGDFNWAIKSRDQSSAGECTHIYSSLMGLRLNAFENNAYQYDDGPTTEQLNGLWETLHDISFTTDKATDVIWMGNACYHGNATTRKGYYAWQDTSNWIPNVSVKNFSHYNCYDGSDVGPMNAVGIFSSTAEETTDISSNVKHPSSSAGQYYKGYTTALFTVELVDWHTQETGGSVLVGSSAWSTLWNPDVVNSATSNIYATTIGVWIPSTSTRAVYVHVSNLHQPIAATRTDEGLRLVPGRVEYFTVLPGGVGTVKASTATGTENVCWSIVTRKVG